AVVVTGSPRAIPARWPADRPDATPRRRGVRRRRPRPAALGSPAGGDSPAPPPPAPRRTAAPAEPVHLRRSARRRSPSASTRSHRDASGTVHYVLRRDIGDPGEIIRQETGQHGQDVLTARDDEPAPRVVVQREDGGETRRVRGGEIAERRIPVRQLAIVTGEPAQGQ